MVVYAYIRNGDGEKIQNQLEVLTLQGYDVLEIQMERKECAEETLVKTKNRMTCGDVLLVQNLTSLGLRSKKLYEFLTDLFNEEKALILLEEEIDSRETSGEQFYAYLKLIYNMERQVISNNTIAALGEARKEGTRIGRPGLDEEKIQEVRCLYKKSNFSLYKISKLVGVSVGSVKKYVKDLK